MIPIKTVGCASASSVPGDFVNVFYDTQIAESLVCMRVMETDGCIDWLPQIYLSAVTLIPEP